MSGTSVSGMRVDVVHEWSSKNWLS